MVSVRPNRLRNSKAAPASPAASTAVTAPPARPAARAGAMRYGRKYPCSGAEADITTAAATASTTGCMRRAISPLSGMLAAAATATRATKVGSSSPSCGRDKADNQTHEQQGSADADDEAVVLPPSQGGLGRGHAGTVAQRREGRETVRPTRVTEQSTSPVTLAALIRTCRAAPPLVGARRSGRRLGFRRGHTHPGSGARGATSPARPDPRSSSRHWPRLRCCSCWVAHSEAR